MSITDELRECIATAVWQYENGIKTAYIPKDRLTAIADRIDERYKRDMATAQQVGYNEGEDAAMRSGWVELPKDADGVPIHVGDEMEFSRFDVSYNPEVTVDGIGAGVFFSFDKKLGRFTQKDANAYRHVQPDSWERIIHDAFVESQEHFGSTDAIAELVERCRRLAGERG